jgi:hypothetical protein
MQRQLGREKNWQGQNELCHYCHKAKLIGVGESIGTGVCADSGIAMMTVVAGRVGSRRRAFCEFGLLHLIHSGSINHLRKRRSLC